MDTLKKLKARYDTMTLDTSQLAEIFHMTPKSVANSISAERFPVKTYLLGKIRVADIEDVAEYITQRKST